MAERFLKPYERKLGRGLRGWPIATIAFCGPNEPSDEGHPLALCPPRMQRRFATGKWIVATSEPRPRYRPGDIGIYREASGAIGHDDRRRIRLPSPRRKQLRRRNGAQFASFGTDDALRGRGTINFCEIKIGNGVTGRPSPSMILVCELISSRYPMARPVYLSMNRHTPR